MNLFNKSSVCNVGLQSSVTSSIWQVVCAMQPSSSLGTDGYPVPFIDLASSKA